MNERSRLDAAYYQSLHDANPAFQGNNWLIQDLPLLREWGGTSILELGCGNGLFLERAVAIWPQVMGLDWAASPVLEDVRARHPGIGFVQADAMQWSPDEPFDIVASADFLEHLPPDRLPALLTRFHGFGRRHFHRIACYDDGHSHLSIFPPEIWMQLFEDVAPGCYRLLSNEARKGQADKRVITVAGFRE
ncbi:MAG: class I SAM-dependent methyltransferase [Thermomonas sp.]|uniref:class I SAM-dependent methyltransferase n=1 Tax=Thermomonas sp. TaxID=1971895 RepID=UPI0039E37039